MSGGSYDYAYSYVTNFAEAMLEGELVYDYEQKDYVRLPNSQANRDLREKVAAHLLKVAKIMKAIEWYDSGDINEDDLRVDLENFLKELKG
jgi:hypothetical protein